MGLGRAALARRDYAGAVEQFEAALALDRRASIVHYPLALAYRGLGKVDEAEAHLRQRGEIEIGPPDPLMRDLAESLHSASMFEARGDRALAAGDFKARSPRSKEASSWRPITCRSGTRWPQPYP